MIRFVQFIKISSFTILRTLFSRLVLGLLLFTYGFNAHSNDSTASDEGTKLLNNISSEIKRYGSEERKMLLTNNSLNNGSYFAQPDCVLFSYFSDDLTELFQGFLVSNGTVYHYVSSEFNDSCKLSDRWSAISNPLIINVLGVNFNGTPLVSIELLIEQKLKSAGNDISPITYVMSLTDLINIGIEY